MGWRKRVELRLIDIQQVVHDLQDRAPVSPGDKEQIMATFEELRAADDELDGKIAALAGTTDTIVTTVADLRTSVADLEAALANQPGDVGVEVQAALDELKAKSATVDALGTKLNDAVNPASPVQPEDPDPPPVEPPAPEEPTGRSRR